MSDAPPSVAMPSFSSHTHQAPPTRALVIGGGRDSPEAAARVLFALERPLSCPVLVELGRWSDELPELLPPELLTPDTLHRARAGEAVRAGCIYLSPSDRALGLDDQGRLTVNPLVDGAIDALFAGAARYFGARLIAVLLSGDGVDGTRGLTQVKQAGGIRLVQSPSDATAPASLSHAIVADEPNVVMLVESIGPALRALCASPTGS